MGRQNLPKPRQDLDSATDGAWPVAVERELDCEARDREIRPSARR
jgi:hypothetical protein